MPQISINPSSSELPTLEVSDATVSIFLERVRSGAPAHLVALNLGLPLRAFQKALVERTEMGTDLYEAATVDGALQLVREMSIIADGPINPDYRGDGDVARDKLRIDVRGKLLPRPSSAGKSGKLVSELTNRLPDLVRALEMAKLGILK